MVAMGVVVFIILVGVVVLVMVVRVFCIAVVGVVRVLCIGAVEMDCAGVADILVLGGVFVVNMVEGMELVVGCVVRLAVWCVNGRRYYLCCFGLKLVEMNGLSVGGFLLGKVILGDCFVLLELGIIGEMVCVDMLMDVVLEVVVVEAVDVVQEGIFVIFRCGCFRDMMVVRVVIEVVVGVVVLVW